MRKIKAIGQFRALRAELPDRSIVKVVLTYREGKWSVFGDPVACRYFGVHKEQDPVVNGISVKADLCRDDA